MEELKKVPSGSYLNGYEGEDTGIAINYPDGQFKFIHACEDKHCDKCDNAKLE